MTDKFEVYRNCFSRLPWATVIWSSLHMKESKKFLAVCGNCWPQERCDLFVVVLIQLRLNQVSIIVNTDAYWRICWSVRSIATNGLSKVVWNYESWSRVLSSLHSSNFSYLFNYALSCCASSFKQLFCEILSDKHLYLFIQKNVRVVCGYLRLAKSQFSWNYECF